MRLTRAHRTVLAAIESLPIDALGRDLESACLSDGMTVQTLDRASRALQAAGIIRPATHEDVVRALHEEWSERLARWKWERTCERWPWMRAVAQAAVGAYLGHALMQFGRAVEAA